MGVLIVSLSSKNAYLKAVPIMRLISVISLFIRCLKGFGGHGELVTRREDIVPAVKRAIASGKTACVNVKVKGVISPIVLATTSKRDKASIE